MTQTSQIKKNFKLSTDLSNYIFDNPHTLGQLPSNASIVAFGDDESLNTANNTMIKSLLSEGTIVIKAQETKKEKTSWKFTPIFP